MKPIEIEVFFLFGATTNPFKRIIRYECVSEQNAAILSSVNVNHFRIDGGVLYT